MIGRTIGTYRVDALLGRGGMGSVYRGLDMMLDRPVAIKVLRSDISSSAQHIERFRQEAKTLARLLHPHIATLYTLLRERDDLYMIMEFVEGETFEALIERERRIGLDRALDLFDQALRGIDYAHRSGVVHRDIKPANFMLTPDGHVKVMDFGIARLLGSRRMTQTSQSIGTAEYMSPEQVRGREVDSRSDVYALGVLLFEMLTGRVPFEDESFFEVMQAHVSTPAPKLRVRSPEAPEALEDAIAQALEKDPADRFPSIAAFRLALAVVDPRFTEGRPSGESPALPAAAHIVVDPTSTVEWRPIEERSGWPGPNERTESESGIDILETPPTTVASPPRATAVAPERPVAQTRAEAAMAPLAAANPPATRIAIRGDASVTPAPAIGMHLAAIGSKVRRHPRVAIGTALVFAVALVGATWFSSLASAPDPGSTDESVAVAESAQPANPAGEAFGDIAQPAQDVPPADSPPTDLGDASSLATPRASRDAPSDPTYVEPVSPSPAPSRGSVRTERPPAQEPAPREERRSEPTRPAAPANGAVRVIVRPFGDVYIDGRREARQTNAPVTVTAEPGVHTVRVTHPSFGTLEQSVTVRPGATSDVLLEFDTPAQITFISDPSNAEIIVDGRATGRYTPATISLDPGTHSVEARRDGYRSSPRSVTVSGGRTPSRLSLPLTQN